MSKKPKLKLAKDVALLRLDLGCGESPAEGYEGVDLHAPNAKHKVDLFKFPWPWADGSVEALHSSHFLEHIPARDVEERDILCKTRFVLVGMDMLCAFMVEAWRVLKVGGEFKIVVPSGRSTRAFQDPTHRRFFHAENFYYFNRAWRDANKLGHYLGNSNFAFEVTPTVPQELSVLSQEAQQRRFAECWNTTYDFHARLVKEP